MRLFLSDDQAQELLAPIRAIAIEARNCQPGRHAPRNVHQTIFLTCSAKISAIARVHAAINSAHDCNYVFPNSDDLDMSNYLGLERV